MIFILNAELIRERVNISNELTGRNEKEAMKEEKEHVKITRKKINQEEEEEKKRERIIHQTLEIHRQRGTSDARETREKFGCVSSALVEDLAAETIGSICIHVRPFHHVPLVVI